MTQNSRVWFLMTPIRVEIDTQKKLPKKDNVGNNANKKGERERKNNNMFRKNTITT